MYDIDSYKEEKRNFESYSTLPNPRGQGIRFELVVNIINMPILSQLIILPRLFADFSPSTSLEQFSERKIIRVYDEPFFYDIIGIVNFCNVFSSLL